ncbi:uncharacterized protein DS421_1g33100 [Arachis hypogaea]|nr:uncharacterized protein DS421_1g33100 [Arachis hypogaea]
MCLGVALCFNMCRKLLKNFNQGQRRKRTIKEAFGRSKKGGMQEETTPTEARFRNKPRKVQREITTLTSSYSYKDNLSYKDSNEAVLVALESQLSELSNDI